jgi:glycosyltransferase involved in cell wall biosynthesis
VSDDLYETVLGLGVPASRCTLIHNAIDEREFSRSMPPAAAPLRAKMGTPAGRLVIGAVGRLSPEKGFDLLVKAAANLIAAGLEIEVWIAGDGDARADLERQIAELKLNDRVKLLGFVGDTISLYQALDVFVLSSLREGLPNVVLEALAMRVPVVSTRVAGVPKMISDGVQGLLVPVNDADALTAAMKRVVDDAGLRERLASEGRSLIEAKYSFTRRMEKVKAVYDRVLTG